MKTEIPAEIRCRTPTCTDSDEEGGALRMPTRAPHAVRVQLETPICTRMTFCKGCRFPRDGFICWFSNGQCMRTLMQKKEKGTGQPHRKNHKNAEGGTHIG